MGHARTRVYVTPARIVFGKKFKKSPYHSTHGTLHASLEEHRILLRGLPQVVYLARDLASEMNASVRVARVANRFVELDVSVDEDDLDTLVEKLSPIGPVDNIRHVFEEEIDKEQGIRDGIFYFNNERFWESHEAFEGVWKKCFGREKELVQGIILMAVAFAHGQKDEHRIGIGMLRQGAGEGWAPPRQHTIP